MADHRAPYSRAADSPGALEPLLGQLAEIMRGQVELHQRLLPVLRAKREAIRRADLPGIEASCKTGHVLSNALCQLEKHRLAVVGRIMALLAPDAASPLSISDIAAHAQCSSEQREGLLAAAAQLKRGLAEAAQLSGALRSAAAALSTHLGSIVETVHAAMSRVKVYGRRGRIAAGSNVKTMVDLRS